MIRDFTDFSRHSSFFGKFYIVKYFFVLLGSKLTDLHIEKFNSVFAAFRSEFT